jgi:hypothetical protein
LTDSPAFSLPWSCPDPIFDPDKPRGNSILDFIFLPNAEGKISGTSKVLQEPRDFPDTGRTSCHRPVQGVLTPHVADDALSLKQQALRRIDAIERELEDLRVPD